MSEQFAVGEIQYRIDVFHVVLSKYIVLLGKRRFYRLRRCGDGGTGIGSNDLHQRRVQDVVHREEDGVERLLLVLLLNEVVDVRDADLCREAGINRAATRSRAIKFRTRIVGIDDVLWLNAKALEVGVEERSIRVD